MWLGCVAHALIGLVELGARGAVMAALSSLLGLVVAGVVPLLLYRLGASDYTPGGLTHEEGKLAAISLVEAGVDLLDISGGLNGSAIPGADGVSQGYFVPMAADIRAGVDVPVVVAGGITEPEFADRVIREGKIDLVAIGRAMLTNPEWAADARKVLAAL